MIRALEPGDRAAIERIVRATEVFSDEEVGVALELVDIAVDHPSQGDYLFGVDAEGEAVCGYVCYGPTPMTDGTFDLYWIAVDPARHGSGVGRRLMEFTERDIASRGGRLIIVETSSKPAYDRTRRFYADGGYVLLAEISNYYRLNDDLVIYGKYLR